MINQLVLKIPHCTYKSNIKTIYSRYHLWEHIFINIVKFTSEKKYDIWGWSDYDQTIIMINSDHIFDRDYVSKIIIRLKKRKISNKFLKREISVLNNELDFIKKHTNSSIDKYPGYGCEYKKLRLECKEIFGLNKIDISEARYSENDMKNKKYYNILYSYVNRNLYILMRRFFENINTVIDKNGLTNHNYLINIPILYAKDDYAYMEIKDYMYNDPLINYMVSCKYHISNIFLFKFSLKNNKIWVNFYFYGNVKQAQYLIMKINNYLLKIIRKYNYINKYLINDNPIVLEL